MVVYCGANDTQVPYLFAIDDVAESYILCQLPEYGIFLYKDIEFEIEREEKNSIEFIFKVQWNEMATTRHSIDTMIRLKCIQRMADICRHR